MWHNSTTYLAKESKQTCTAQVALQCVQTSASKVVGSGWVAPNKAITSQGGCDHFNETVRDAKQNQSFRKAFPMFGASEVSCISFAKIKSVNTFLSFWPNSSPEKMPQQHSTSKVCSSKPAAALSSMPRRILWNWHAAYIYNIYILMCMGFMLRSACQCSKFQGNFSVGPRYKNGFQKRRRVHLNPWNQ